MHAEVYVIFSPTDPFFHDANGEGLHLLAMSDNVCPQPCRTRKVKLRLNYAAGFLAHRIVAALDYQ